MKEKYVKTEAGIIPADWSSEKLLDQAKLLNGLTYSPENVKDYGLLVIRSSNIQNGQLCFEDNVYVNCDVDEEKLIHKGDIIICIRNGSAALIGKCAIAKRDYQATFGAFMAVLRSEYADYIHQIFSRGELQKQIRRNSDATINQITNKDFNSIHIAIPKDKKEIDAISETLCDVDSLILNLQGLIAKKENVLLGTIQSLMSGEILMSNKPWKSFVIGQIGDFYGGLSGKTKSDFGVGNSKFITFLNVLRNTVIDTSILDHVNIREGEVQNAVVTGDLFFNTSSETPEEVGMCSVLLESSKDTYLNSFCFGYRLNTHDVDPLFLSYYFNSSEGRKIMRVLAQGATRYNLSKEYFSKCIIRIPELNDQKAISELLLDMENEIGALKCKLYKYQQLKQGMMENLLTGKIRLV